MTGLAPTHSIQTLARLARVRFDPQRLTIMVRRLIPPAERHEGVGKLDVCFDKRRVVSERMAIMRNREVGLALRVERGRHVVMSGDMARVGRYWFKCILVHIRVSERTLKLALGASFVRIAQY